MSKKYVRPPIVVTDDEHERLLDLALSALDRTPGAADLYVELSRAKTVRQLPKNAIGIDRVASFEYDGEFYSDYALVDPHRADFSQHRISVLTPVGAMLLGLSEGQTIEWTGKDGRSHNVRVARVREGAPGPAPAEASA